MLNKSAHMILSRFWYLMMAGLVILGVGLLCIQVRADVVPDSRSVVRDGIGDITVRQYAMVNSDFALLGDIADINIAPFLKTEIERIDICRAPKPGDVKILEKNQIDSALRSREDLLESAVIRIPEKIYIKRASQDLKAEDVRDSLLQYLKNRIAGSELELKQLRVTGLEPYPAGNLALSFSGNVPDNGGRVSLKADILIDGRQYDRIMVNAWIDLFRDLVCASTDLDRGDRIDATVCRPCRINVSTYRSSLADSLDQVDGHVLKTGVKSGDPIEIDRLRVPPVIQKGDLVKLVAKKKNLMIVAMGIAKEDGYADEAIRVENLGSGKLVRGLVRDESQVQVMY